MITDNFKVEKKEKTSYPPLPENVYQVELIDVSVENLDTKQKDGSMKKEDFFKLELGLLDGEENGESLRGRRAWMNYIPTYFYIGNKKNKLYTVVETLLRRELTPAEEATFEAVSMNNLVGMQMRIIIKHTTKDGKTYGNIDSLLKVTTMLPALTEAEKTSKPEAKESDEDKVINNILNEIRAEDIPM